MCLKNCYRDMVVRDKNKQLQNDSCILKSRMYHIGLLCICESAKVDFDGEIHTKSEQESHDVQLNISYIAHIFSPRLEKNTNLL